MKINYYKPKRLFLGDLKEGKFFYQDFEVVVLSSEDRWASMKHCFSAEENNI